MVLASGDAAAVPAAGAEADSKIDQEWLHSARFVELLGADVSHKSISILVKHPSGDRGVLIANKSPFPEAEDQISRILKKTSLTLLAKNDVYGNYRVEIPVEDNAISCTLIYPASDKIIAKYRKEEKFIVKETAEDYETITKEWIKQYQLELTWVYNFIEGRSEAERVIFKDPDAHNGFLMAPDLKWNGEDLECLYLLAVINRKGVKSVRDLTADDIPLLENVRDKGLAAIREKYGLRPDQIRVYFHYQPSFYHLHMHFVTLAYDAPATGILQAILLDDVIENLRIDSAYYKKATLSFLRKKKDKLLDMFRAAGRALE